MLAGKSLLGYRPWERNALTISFLPLYPPLAHPTCGLTVSKEKKNRLVCSIKSVFPITHGGPCVSWGPAAAGIAPGPSVRRAVGLWASPVGAGGSGTCFFGVFFVHFYLFYSKCSRKSASCKY